MAGLDSEQQQELAEMSATEQLSQEEELLLEQVQVTITRQLSDSFEHVLAQTPMQQQQQQQQQQDQKQQSHSTGCTAMHSRAPTPGAAAAAAAAAGLEVVQQEPTIAPDDDVLYFFRRIYSMPPFPGERQPVCSLQRRPSCCLLYSASSLLLLHRLPANRISDIVRSQVRAGRCYLCSTVSPAGLLYLTCNWLQQLLASHLLLLHHAANL
jgi:hypothetical protein